MYKLGLVSVLFSLTIFLSCSNSTDSDESEESAVASSTFTVTGDLEAKQEGIAYFTELNNDGNLVRVSIHLVETHPQDRDENTESDYSLILVADMSGEPFTLSTGTYEIGKLSDEELNFTAVYTHRISGSQVNGYNTEDQSGTITITSVSDNWIEATFSFAAINYDDGHGEDEHISISGEFNAECFGFSC
ncbi:MAG: hypothetical protein WD016_12790 [Balneolaceae bacterium]